MQQPVTRPPYGWAAATGAVILAVYLATLAPTTAFWDTSEYIAAAKVLGIPHPPGNPLFTLTAHVFGLLPLAATYAARINVYAAVTSAAAAALWFLVAERWLEGIVENRWARLGAAFAGIFVGATSWTVWNQSTVNEKVYTFSLLSIALCMWLAVRWSEWVAAGEQRDRLLVCIAYLLGLTWTNHTMGLLAGPAMAAYVLVTDARVLTRWKTLLASAVAGAAGASLNYIYLPIRAGQYPPINEGEPVGFFSKALMDVLNREQYGKPSVFERQADFLSQLQNYWQYWSWQFARDWGPAAFIATAVFTVLGLYGLLVLWRKDKRAGLALATLMGTVTIALIFYLNFKYGFSIHPDQPDLAREVRERDYFFVASFAAFGVLLALGFGGLMRVITESLKTGEPAQRWLMASPVLALAFVPLLGNHATASRAGETVARDFARDILESVEPYGILITAGDNDTFPLWYAQEVEGIRKDVTLANLSLMNTTWHLHQLRRRETPAFDLSTSVPLWGKDVPSAGAAGSGTTWTRPTEPVLPFTIEQIDQLPPIARAPSKDIDAGGLHLELGTDVVQLQDLATIALIKQNLGKRAIYFSWSDGGYPDQMLGLSRHLVSQGFVRRLSPTEVVPNDSIVMSPQLGLLDLPRSRELLEKVYRWPAAARPRPHGWVDVPSSSILQLYGVVYSGLAGVLRERGDTAGAQKADSISRAVQQNIAPMR